MEVLYWLIPIAILFAGGGVGAFLIALDKGQFDDLETPAHRMLTDEDKVPHE